MKKYKWYIIAFTIFIIITFPVDVLVTNRILNFVTCVIIAAILWSWADFQSKPRKMRDST